MPQGQGQAVQPILPAIFRHRNLWTDEQIGSATPAQQTWTAPRATIRRGQYEKVSGCSHRSLATSTARPTWGHRPARGSCHQAVMLLSWPQHDRLNSTRIGIFDFSAGGFTALVAIGGVPDLSLGRSHCAAHSDDWGCRTAREKGVQLSGPPLAFDHDPRIAAAVIAAPIQLWRGEIDEIVPHPRHAKNVYDGAGEQAQISRGAKCRPLCVPGSPCTPALANLAPEGCRDPAGFDRAAFNREFNSAVVAFFKAKLHA